MLRDAKKHGFVAHAPSLHRADGRATMRELAEEIREIVEKNIPQDAELHVIGFSMGGVVAREYAQMLGGARRMRSLTTIGSPHKGSLWAYLHPMRGARDMRFQSECLRALQDNEHVLGELPCLAVHTPFDTSILPYTSAIWHHALNKRFWLQFHPFMTFSPRIRKTVWQFIREHSVKAKTPVPERF